MGAFGIEAPLVTLGIQLDRPATEYGYLLPDLDRRRAIDGLQAYPLMASRRSQIWRGRPSCSTQRGRRLERRDVPVAAPRDPRRARAVHRPASMIGVEPGTPGRRPRRAYDRLRSISIDYAVMEPAAATGQVVMGSMDVGWSDLGSWTPLLGELGGRGRARRPARRGGRGRRRRTSWSGAIAGRLARGRPARQPRPGRYDGRVDWPVALLTGARPRQARIEALLDRVPNPGGPPVTTISQAPQPDDDRLRHRRLAGPDRRRLHVRERPPLRRRRRALRRRAGRAGQGRRHRLRPAVRLGALRRGRRRGPPRPRHPGRLSPGTPCRPRCARTRSSSAAPRPAS